MTTAYRKQSGGDECISCCPVAIVCDCDLIECVTDFYRYALNANAAQYTGHLVNEVAFHGMKLIGFAVLGTIERPGDDAENTVTFGRSLVQALIEAWQVEGSDMQTELQEIDRVFRPYLSGFLVDQCGCDENNIDKVDCLALKCIMDTIHTYGRIGHDGKPPYSLKEWAEGGLCGVCYQDCDGNDYVFDKVA